MNSFGILNLTRKKNERELKSKYKNKKLSAQLIFIIVIKSGPTYKSTWWLDRSGQGKRPA
jgi:hypothetical protein